MNNPFSEIHTAINAAKEQLSAADSVAGILASLLIGRLRMVRANWVLSALKRELRDWDMHTCKWKERK